MSPSDTYPGSTKKRRTKTTPPEPVEKPVIGWDAKPVFLLFKGQTIEFFRRGAFAKALNRQVVTIRAMTMAGVIPNPAVKDGHGRWLYTREQIEDMIALAIEEGVYDPTPRAQFSKRFVEEAHRILSRQPV